MNLKELEKEWAENFQIESNGMIKKRSMPKKWLMKLKLHYRKLNTKKDKIIDKEKS